MRIANVHRARLGALADTGPIHLELPPRTNTGDYAVGSVAGRRLDTLNDESFQTIVVLEGPSTDLVRAVLVASDVREVGTRDGHEAVVERATAAAVAP